MKTPSLRLVFLIALLPLGAWAGIARITFDTGDVIDRFDPRIYGVLTEPNGFSRPGMKFYTLFRPLYDPKSPHAEEHGFRTDMLVAARELKLTDMRWPGGNFFGSYDWRDGIGPKDRRPKRLELAWSVVGTNQVGTDEWVQLNQHIGSENVTCINMGTGTIDAPYTDEARDTYIPKGSEVAVKGATLHYDFPAHSFTQIVVGVNRSWGEPGPSPGSR